jgi:hypothetical protein
LYSPETQGFTLGYHISTFQAEFVDGRPVRRREETGESNNAPPPGP